MWNEDKVVYLGLGANIGDRLATLNQTIALIKDIPKVIDLEVSSFYETAPISDIPQPNYLNAVCRLKTSLNARELLFSLQTIEALQGKTNKPKNFPRVIDIDILFFGIESHSESECEIPHPRWNRRLFVVVPLLELTQSIAIPCKNQNIEIIDLLKLKDSLKEELCIKYL